MDRNMGQYSTLTCSTKQSLIEHVFIYCVDLHVELMTLDPGAKVRGQRSL